MIKAIIFDCFGVIISDALSVLCGHLETSDPRKFHEIRSLIHAANKGIISPELSTASAAKLLDMSIEQYREAIRKNEVRDQTLLDYIQNLRKQYKTAMLSNVTEQGIQKRFPGNELAEYFDEVIVSSAIGFAKPEIEAYQITIDRLGVLPDNCIFTDDRANYCAGAEAVGMRAIVYESFAQFKRELTEILKTD